MEGRSLAVGVLLGLLIGGLAAWGIADLAPQPTATHYVTSSSVQTVYITPRDLISTTQRPPPPGQGPFYHQILSASSPNGLDWTLGNHVLLDHASVPSAIVTSEGTILVYYVDATQVPETTNCAGSMDGGLTFKVLGCTIANRQGDKALDPSIVRLPDGRYRLYYYASATDPNTRIMHAIHSAISNDGIHFSEEGEVFSYPGIVDPDVFWTGEQWLMFVFSLTDGATIISRSKSGLSFQYVGPLNLKDWGTTAPVRLDNDLFRLYAFDQRTAKTIASFVSSDGVNWVQELGVRLTAPAGQRITDPFVIHLPDGTWKMIYKSERENKLPANNAQTLSNLGVYLMESRTTDLSSELLGSSDHQAHLSQNLVAR